MGCGRGRDDGVERCVCVYAWKIVGSDCLFGMLVTYRM